MWSLRRYLPTNTVGLSAIRIIFLACLLSFLVGGCSTTAAPVNTQTTTNSSSFAEATTTAVTTDVRGYWETVNGQLTLSEPPGKIYFYDWYAIESQSGEKVIVIWDNGLNCSRTEGVVRGNAIHLTPDDVETTFVIHDSQHATVSFRYGETTYTKELEKKRDSPNVVCS